MPGDVPQSWQPAHLQDLHCIFDVGVSLPTDPEPTKLRLLR